jgi:hypothetical protein
MDVIEGLREVDADAAMAIAPIRQRLQETEATHLLLSDMGADTCHVVEEIAEIRAALSAATVPVLVILQTRCAEVSATRDLLQGQVPEAELAELGAQLAQMEGLSAALCALPTGGAAATPTPDQTPALSAPVDQCPAGVTPCRDGAACAVPLTRENAAHFLQLWHPPQVATAGQYWAADPGSQTSSAVCAPALPVSGSVVMATVIADDTGASSISQHDNSGQVAAGQQGGGGTSIFDDMEPIGTALSQQGGAVAVPPAPGAAPAATFGQPQPTHMQPASIFADSGAAHPAAAGQIAPQPARGPSVFDEVREEVQSGGRVAYKIETAQVRCTHARYTPLLPGSGHPRTDCLTDQAELAKAPILVAAACRHREGVACLPG